MLHHKCKLQKSKGQKSFRVYSLISMKLARNQFQNKYNRMHCLSPPENPLRVPHAPSLETYAQSPSWKICHLADFFSLSTQPSPYAIAFHNSIGSIQVCPISCVCLPPSHFHVFAEVFSMEEHPSCILAAHTLSVARPTLIPALGLSSVVIPPGSFPNMHHHLPLQNLD